MRIAGLMALVALSFSEVVTTVPMFQAALPVVLSAGNATKAASDGDLAVDGRDTDEAVGDVVTGVVRQHSS